MPRSFLFTSDCSLMFSDLSAYAYKRAADSGLVLVEPSPALLPQPACIHHLDQQWTRPVLGIAQAILQYSHDVEADVEADKIRQGQRAHGMRHSQLENFVH